MDKCIHCEGTGKATCKTCGGDGKVACSACGGSGRETSICPTCTKGYVPDPRSMDDEPTLKCPDCHGEWQKDIGPCKECNGTGRIRCSDCEGTGKKVCSACGGVGELDVVALCKKLIDIKSSSNIEIHKDQITADMVPIIQNAADNGVGLATVIMGNLYAYGLKVDEKVVVEENSEKAMAYLRKGAEVGDCIAQGTYGLWQCIGIGVKEDVQTGFPWFVKAGANGNIESLYLMAIDGYIYDEYGQGRNLIKSLECFKAILNAKGRDAWYQGYISSAEGYVKFLPDIINNDAKAMIAFAEWIRVNEKYEDRSGDEDHLYWLEQAAKAGDADDMTKVARLYSEWGEVGKANAWYEKAADQGNVEALLKFGSHLRTGDGVEKDARRALVYLYRAAEHENTSAINALARMYYNGEYVHKSYERAVELYSRAAKLGSGYALGAVGIYYLKQKKDEAEAKRLLQLAIEKGYDHDRIKAYLAEIPDSVKVSTKKPSGIKGVPDKGPLPKFLKGDYEQAVAGKPALTVDVKESKQKDTKEQHPSDKKRWKFVVLGILFGFLGLHLAYAKRWFLFLLLWAAFITGGVMSGGKGDPEKTATDAEAAQTTQSEDGSKKKTDSPISNIGFAVWGLLWIGGTLFIKKDGKGNRM